MACPPAVFLSSSETNIICYCPYIELTNTCDVIINPSLLCFFSSILIEKMDDLALCLMDLDQVGK